MEEVVLCSKNVDKVTDGRLNLQVNDEDEMYVNQRRIRKPMLDSDDDTDNEFEKHSGMTFMKDSQSISCGSQEKLDKSPDYDTLKSDRKENKENSCVKARRKIKVFTYSDTDDDLSSNKTVCEQRPETVFNKFDVLKDKNNRVDESVPISVDTSNTIKNCYANKDLFDAEDSSDGDNLSTKSFENDDEDEISLNNIKKQARNSAIKENASKTRRKPRKNSMQQLHGESQRLLREGRVTLPYHVPQKKTLDEFLNRKKYVPNVLKPKASEIEKTYQNIQSSKQKSVNLEANGEVLKVIDCSEVKLPCDDDLLSAGKDKEDLMEEVCQSVLDELCNNVNNICTAGNEVSQSNSQFPKSDEDSVKTCLSGLSNSKRVLLEQRLLNSTPKLKGLSNSVICLDEDEQNAFNGQVQDFINRFIEHRVVKPRESPKQIELNILKKQHDSEGEVVLSNEKLLVTLPGKPLISTETNLKPGACRMQLKQNLQAKMAERRAQHRQKLSLTTPSNKDDSNLNEGDEKLDDVDLDNTDSESEEVTESEDEDIITEKPRKKNAFVDDEAEEEDGDSEIEESEDEFDSKSITSNAFSSTATKTVENDQPAGFSKTFQNSNFIFDSNSENIGSDSGESDKQSDIRKNLEFGSTSLPQDDSLSESQKMLSSQFVLNTNSNIEFLKPSNRFQCAYQDILSTQDNLEELAVLCSGKWTEPTSNAAAAIQDLCDAPTKSSVCFNDELADLCSGKFPEVDSDRPENELHSCFEESNLHVDEIDATMNTRLEIDSDDDLSICSLTSENLKRKKIKRIVSDSEDENSDSDDECRESYKDSDVEDEDKPSKHVRKFMDDEAELSGSDIPSDEDEDIAEEDDVMLEEMGDLDEYSEDELKDQVEKVHMKLLMDDDQRQLRHVKELYLEDGDLHMDGVQRLRKFRWKNTEDSSDNESKNQSDNEINENEDDEDHELRKNRFERESWLNMEQKNISISSTEDENMFANLQKKVHLLNHVNSQKIVEKSFIERTPLSAKTNKESPIYRGSFLSKKENFLTKIANMTKTTSDGPSGPNNSRNFVFAAMSPPKTRPNKNQQMKRLSSVGSSNMNSISKRLCPNSQDSIFDLL